MNMIFVLVHLQIDLLDMLNKMFVHFDFVHNLVDILNIL